MSNDELKPRPAPTGLDDAFDIIRQLRQDDASTSWLAHERHAHRDVVVTIVYPGGLPRRELLSELGADAQLLRTHSHPSVVPILATRWLNDGTLALVRPRVRGTTMRHILDATGALSLERAVELLREVGGALDWARRNGVAHRGLTSESVCFQQGSGRVLVTFGPALLLEDEEGRQWARQQPDLGPILSRCSDTATLGRLAWEMLTTRPAPVSGDAGAMSVRRGYREPGLADLRPDLPLSVAAEIEGALRCERDNSARGPTAFLAALAASAGAQMEPIASSMPTSPVLGEPTHVPSPVVHRDDPESFSERTAWTMPPVAAPAKPRRSGAGVMAFTIAAVVVLAAIALLMQRGGDDTPRTATRARVAQRTVSTGDVEFDRSRIDTGVLVVPGARRTPDPMPAPMADQLPAPATGGRTVFAPPDVSPLPPATPNASSLPSAVATGDPCASPIDSDQQVCLRDRIARNDAELNRSYQELTRALRDDPGAVSDLRQRQRVWLSQRDAECRSRVERAGTWAESFARCLGELSDQRARELQGELTRRRGGI